MHSNILAWKIPWAKEPGGLQSVGLQRVRYNYRLNTHTRFETHCSTNKKIFSRNVDRYKSYMVFNCVPCLYNADYFFIMKNEKACTFTFSPIFLSLMS